MASNSEQKLLIKFTRASNMWPGQKWSLGRAEYEFYLVDFDNRFFLISKSAGWKVRTKSYFLFKMLSIDSKSLFFTKPFV